MPLQIELYCDTVPRTTFNFLSLAASGYYTGTIFHRNIKGFMVQGGDPTGGGKGGASIWGGKFADEIHPDNKHTSRGIVSMANSGPNTNGSQFFITYARHPHLDNNYTVFGKVIDGLDTLDAIERTPCSDKHRPLKEVRAQSCRRATGQRLRAVRRAGLMCASVDPTCVCGAAVGIGGTPLSINLPRPPAAAAGEARAHHHPRQPARRPDDRLPHRHGSAGHTDMRMPNAIGALYVWIGGVGVAVLLHWEQCTPCRPQ